MKGDRSSSALILTGLPTAETHCVVESQISVIHCSSKCTLRGRRTYVEGVLLMNRLRLKTAASGRFDVCRSIQIFSPSAPTLSRSNACSHFMVLALFTYAVITIIFIMLLLMYSS